LEQARTQLQREPKALPHLAFKRRPHSLFDYRYEDFVFAGYEPHPPIRAEVAV
jgi:thymidylate synthase